MPGMELPGRWDTRIRKYKNDIESLTVPHPAKPLSYSTLRIKRPKALPHQRHLPRHRRGRHQRLGLYRGKTCKGGPLPKLARDTYPAHGRVFLIGTDNRYNAAPILQLEVEPCPFPPVAGKK